MIFNRFQPNVFLSHIVILFFIFKVLLCPSLSRVSRPPITQNSAAIVSRSVKVLPFLASLTSFHQRVFLTRQIVFGEFFYAFFFFLCARLLFLFTQFCVFCANTFFQGDRLRENAVQIFRQDILIQYRNQVITELRLTNYFFTEISIFNFIRVKHII